MKKLIVLLFSIIVSNTLCAQGLSVELLKKAEAGDTDAMCNVGICYKNGLDCVKDDSKMLYWFNKAAEKGHARAMYNLGCLYDSGKGVKKDLSKAVEWYKKSAEKDDIDAMYNLGCCLHEGLGTAADNRKAAKWFKKSAINGHLGSMEILANAYYTGDGVPQSRYLGELFTQAVININHGDNEKALSSLKKEFPNLVIKK